MTFYLSILVENPTIMIDKHKNFFTTVKPKIYKQLTKSVQTDFRKYNGIRKNVLKMEDELVLLQNQIQKTKTKLKRSNEMLNHLYNKIQFLKTDWDPSVSFVSYSKKMKKGSNLFWNVNIKFRNTTKSIYLGSDQKLRSYLISHNEVRKTIKTDRFRREFIEFHLIDNVKDWCIDNGDNIHDSSVNFETLLNYDKKLINKFL